MAWQNLSRGAQVEWIQTLSNTLSEQARSVRRVLLAPNVQQSMNGTAMGTAHGLVLAFRLLSLSYPLRAVARELNIDV